MQGFSGYIAEVTSVDGRRVKVKSDLLPELLCDPLSFGHLKLKVPDVGDQVAVFIFDTLNNHRYYIPVGSKGELNEDEDSEYILLGKQPSESAVLGNVLNDKLDQILDAIKNHTHGITAVPVTGGTAPSGGGAVTGGTANGETDAPTNASSFTSIQDTLSENLSEVVKLK